METITIKLTEKAKKEIVNAFIESANFTKAEYYNKDYEERKSGVDAYFHGVLESKLKALCGIDISEVWDILRDTTFHAD